MAIATVERKQEVKAIDHNSIVGLLNGTANDATTIYAQPVKLYQLNDANVFSLTVGNQDTTNGLIARFQYGTVGAATVVADITKQGILTKIRDKGGVTFDLDAYATGTINNLNGSSSPTVSDAAWLACFAAVAAAGGGRVRLGSGTYLAPPHAATYPDRMIIQGAGIDATTILHQGYAQAGNQHWYAIYYYGRTGCGITDLTIDGNAGDSGVSNVDTGWGFSEVALDGTDNWAYRIKVKNFWNDGITVTGTNISVIKCRIQGLASGSPTVPSYTDYYGTGPDLGNIVHPTAGGSNNGIANAGVSGLSVGVKNVLIEGNYITGMRASAIFVGANGLMVRDNIVEDCHRWYIFKIGTTPVGGGQIAPAPIWDGTLSSQSPTYCFYVNNKIGPTLTPTYAAGFEFNNCNHVYGVNNTVDTVPGFGLSNVNGTTDLHWAHGEFKSTPYGVAVGTGVSRWSLEDLVFQSCSISAVSVTGTSEYWRLSGCRFEGNNTGSATGNYDGTGLTGQNYQSYGNIVVDGGAVPTYTYKARAGSFAQQLINGATAGLGLYVQAEGPAALGSSAAVLFEQLTGDAAILQFSSAGDIATGATSLAPTTVYGQFAKLNATQGGLAIYGLADAGGTGLYGYGIAPTDNTTQSAAGRAYVEFTSGKISGTTFGACGATANIFGIQNATTTELLVTGNGNIYYDGTTNAGAWDEHDDIALLETFRTVTAPGVEGYFSQRFSDALEANRDVLTATGVIVPDPDIPGRVMVSHKDLTGLLIDSIRQLHMRLNVQESRLLALGAP